MKIRRVLFAVFAALLPLLAQAQTWPQRPVKLIVPYPPGGATDIFARIVAERLSSGFNQQFVADNRPGAAGQIATEVAARAPGDGYTLLFATTPQICVVPLLQKMSIDPVKDLAPISAVGSNPFVLGIHPSIPANTVKEFVDYAKARPGQLNYGSAGTGGMVHLTAALFVSRAGLTLTHVPYKGFSLAVSDLVSNQLQMYFGNAAELMQLSKSGKIKLLAVSSPKRMPQLPNLPAVAEFYPGFRTITWSGVFAPVAVPREVIDRTARELARAVREPAFIERLAANGFDPMSTTPAEFAEMIKSELPVWRAAVDAAGVKPE